MNKDNYVLSFRLQTGIKQQNLAKWLGCSRSNVSMAETEGRLLAKEPERKLNLLINIIKDAEVDMASYCLPVLEDENECRKLRRLRQELKDVDSRLNKAADELQKSRKLLYFLDKLKTIEPVDEKEWNYQKRMAINKYERCNYTYRQLAPKRAAIEASILTLTKLLEDEKREQGRIDGEEK